MAGQSVASLKYILGLLTGGFRANHPLKSCKKCDRESAQENGTTIWRLVHQLPTSLYCQSHGERLWISRTKSDGTDRFNWQLPDDQHRVSSVETLDVDDKTLLKVSATSRGIYDLGSTYSFDPSRMVSTVKTRLGELGFLTRGGFIRQRVATKSYLDTVGSLGTIASLRGLPTNREGAERLIRSAVVASSQLMHPAKHIVIISWLWPDFPAFHRDYRHAELADTRQDEPSALTKVNSKSSCPDKAPQHRLTALLADGMSVTCAAEMLGTSIVTVQRVAAECGIAVSRRPKKLKGQRLERLLNMAREGRSKHDIANRLSVDPQTVMRVISTVPDLKKEWSESRAKKTLHDYRQRWLGALGNSRLSGVKATRSKASNVYAWLYRNDRVWLNSTNQRCCPRNSSRGDAVDWVARDDELAAEIQRLRGSGATGSRISLGGLCEQVPELRARVRQLHRLPKTSEQVSRALAGVPPHND